MTDIRPSRSRATEIWNGPPDLSRSLKLEWRFILIRWLGICCVAPGLPFARLSSDELISAYAVLVAAALYNFGVQQIIRRRPSLLASGFLTTIGDALLNIAMLTFAGGFNSPLYYILYTVTIASAMRYGYAVSIGTALLFVSADVTESTIHGGQLGPDFVFRSGFLILTALLASYLHEQAESAQTALQERLREANDLNDAVALLGASLDIEIVLSASVAAACHLFKSPFAVLIPSMSLRNEQPGTSMVTSIEDGPVPEWWSEFTTTCAQVAEQAQPLNGNADPFVHARAVGNHDAIFLTLGRVGRPTSLAMLAIVIPPNPKHPKVAVDVVRSFRERVTLAIENATLYQTLTTRSADLQSAYADLAVAHEQLMRVNEMKTSFLANVSHEFRTPLSSIRSFSELLLSYDDPTVQRDFLEIINHESERLTRMVNDVLDITRIESGNMSWNMTEVNVERLALEAARTYVPVMERHNLRFVTEVGPNLPTIRGDWDRLSQVLANLLDNAMKFTRKGQVTLTAGVVGSEVQIAIADTGFGIAQRHQSDIFEKFHQVGEVLTDKPRGAGLGLSICREIVDHHHGRIWVESEAGRGSRFVVALPVMAAMPTNGMTSPASPSLVMTH
jgi:signal transduction histidine kinase